MTAEKELAILKLQNRKDHILRWAWALDHDRSLRTYVVMEPEAMVSELRQIDARLRKMKGEEN